MATIDGLYIEITDKCNLHCDYCCRNCDSNNNHFLDLVVIDRLLSTSADHGANTVAISGGEPLLHPQILEIANLVKKYNYKSTLLTNGVLLSTVDYSLIKMFDGIQISVDGGSASTNDQTRGYGSFNRIITGIESILAKGYNAEKIAFKMTITAQNHSEIKQLGELAHRYGVTNIGFSFIFNEGRAKETLDSFLNNKQKKYVLEELHKLELEHPEIKISPPGYTDECPLIKDNNMSLSPRVDVHGNVYACQMFEGIFSIGNIYKQNIADIINGDKLFSLKQMVCGRRYYMIECSNCFMSQKCKRGCPGIAAHSGCILETDGMCYLRKSKRIEYMKSKL